MSVWIIWLIAGAALLIVEVLTQTMWTLCLAIGSLLAMVAALCGLGPWWQLAALPAGALLAYLLVIPWLRRMHLSGEQRAGREARTGMDALLGRRATVTHEIRPDHPGRARIDGDNWQVTAPAHDGVIPRGAEVIVTGYDSIILRVAPAD